jgi:putative phage-type endonuclease
MHGIPTHYDTREEWLEARRAGIGASDVPQILNLPGAFGGPFRVWMDKQFPGELDDDVSDAMHWGIRHEPTIGLEFEERHALSLVQLGFTIYRHPQHEWAACTPDFVYRENKDHFVEAKTSRSSTGWGDHLTTEIPEHYRSQVLWQMGVLGIAEITVALLIAGSDYREYVIPFDKELFDLMLAEVGEWRERHIDPDGPVETPSLDDSPLAIAFLRQRFPEDTGESAVALSETMRLVPRLLEAKATQKEAGKARTTIENQIKGEIGINAAIVDASNTLIATWKNAKGSLKTDWEAAYSELRAWVSGYGDDAIERADEIIEVNTREAPGGRRFLLKISESYFEEDDDNDE